VKYINIVKIRKFYKEVVLTRSLFSIFVIAAMLLLSIGCSGGQDMLLQAEEAVRAQDYDQAVRYARRARSSNRKEANIILNYRKYGDNMLHAAFWNEDLEAVKYLAGIIYDIDATEERFEAPVLVLAAAWGHTDIVKILLEAGADPNSGSDNSGLTALLWSAKNFDEQLEMAEALLDAGADVNVKTRYNETAIQIAQTYGNPNIANLFKKKSADLEGFTQYAKAVSDGQWNYFCSWDDGYKIYKIKDDDSGLKKVNEDMSRHLNISGAWLYYENIDDEGRIYRIKTDGSSREKISDHRAWNTQYYDGWLYYGNIDDGNKIYKIREDGSGSQKLNNAYAWGHIIDEEWVYYENMDKNTGSGKKIYRVKKDGSNDEMIIDNAADAIIVDKEWIYFTVFAFDDLDLDYRLHRIKKDGTGPEQIGDDYAFNIAFHDGWIYYISGSEGANIYRLRPDGSGLEKLNEEYTFDFYLLGDWIYYGYRDYENAQDDFKTVKMKIDGTQRQVLD
jgi:hypothetical protein